MERPAQAPVLALVPARGGSRGLPGKNVAPLGGRPLIAWSIAAARQAACVGRVVVSTDDPAIAAAGRAAGAEVPFLRPAELARDDTPGVAPALHLLEWLREAGQDTPEWLAYLQPTSPLRTAADIDGAFAVARDRGADAVLAVVEPKHHPDWMLRPGPDGWLEELAPREAASRRQELPPVYALNGALYLVRARALAETGTFRQPRTAPWVMPWQRSVDIDTADDLQLAAWLLGNES